MSESQRRAYLEAMDINVWVRKPGVEDMDRLVLGQGLGSTLLLCRDFAESEIPVALDICRYLADSAVWAWPDHEQNAHSLPLKSAIDQQLFTRVVLLGKALAGRLFPGEVPPVHGSAHMIVAADMDELVLSATARKDLWQKLSGANRAEAA